MLGEDIIHCSTDPPKSVTMLVSALLLLSLLATFPVPPGVEATSFKMDFLSSGAVRTDPLMFSQTGECLSDHVHRFYGAASDRTMRPGVSYQAKLLHASKMPELVSTTDSV